MVLAAGVGVADHDGVERVDQDNAGVQVGGVVQDDDAAADIEVALVFVEKKNVNVNANANANENGNESEDASEYEN